MGFRSVQPTIPATAATAAATFTMLAHFINVPFGLLIRDVLNNGCDSDEASPYSPPATAPNLTRECNSKHRTCLLHATVAPLHVRSCKERQAGVGSAFHRGNFCLQRQRGARHRCSRASLAARPPFLKNF